MRLILFVFSAFFLLSSCQRETSMQHTTGTLPDSTGMLPGDTTDVLLTKMVVTENGSTSISEYGYDEAGRLIRTRTYAQPPPPGAVQDTTTWLLYHYDNLGRFSTLKRDLPQNNTSFDTTDFIVRYVDATSDKIAFIKSHFEYNSNEYTDSLAYDYDAAGNVVKTTRYQYKSSGPAASKAVMYTTRTYDANRNLTQMQQYTPEFNAPDSIAGDTKLSVTYQFHYDAKTNPLLMGAAFIEYYWYQAVSPNNLVMQTNIYPGGETEVLTTTYEYRADGRPTAAHFSDDGNRTVETVYYYNK